MKVSDILLSASVMEVHIYSTVSDTLYHPLTVVNEHVVCEASVVTLVVLHLDVESRIVPLETFLGVYSLFRGHFRHAVDVHQV